MKAGNKNGQQRVLVACEESQIICKEFRRVGHEAYSCDLKKCSGGKPDWHIQGDVIPVMYEQKWDLMIAHPPCTLLTVTGNKWMKPEFAERFPDRNEKREEAVKFFMMFANAPIHRICIENPVGIMSSRWRPSDQIIQPFQFGHTEAKQTALWLKNLPGLLYKKDLFFEGYEQKEAEYHYTKSGKRMPKWYAYADNSKGQENRAEIRSKTFIGIARAMADQWGAYIREIQ